MIGHLCQAQVLELTLGWQGPSLLFVEIAKHQLYECVYPISLIQHDCCQWLFVDMLWMGVQFVSLKIFICLGLIIKNSKYV